MQIALTFSLLVNNIIGQNLQQIDQEVCQELKLLGLPCDDDENSNNNNIIGVGSIDDFYSDNYDSETELFNDYEFDYSVPQARIAMVNTPTESQESIDAMDRELAAIFGVGIDEVNSDNSNDDDGEHASQSVPKKPNNKYVQGFRPYRPSYNRPGTTTQATTTTMTTTARLTTTLPTTTTIPSNIDCQNLKDDAQCEALKLWVVLNKNNHNRIHLLTIYKRLIKTLPFYTLLQLRNLKRRKRNSLDAG